MKNFYTSPTSLQGPVLPLANRVEELPTCETGSRVTSEISEERAAYFYHEILSTVLQHEEFFILIFHHQNLKTLRGFN